MTASDIESSMVNIARNRCRHDKLAISEVAEQFYLSYDQAYKLIHNITFVNPKYSPPEHVKERPPFKFRFAYELFLDGMNYEQIALLECPKRPRKPDTVRKHLKMYERYLTAVKLGRNFYYDPEKKKQTKNRKPSKQSPKPRSRPAKAEVTRPARAAQSKALSPNAGFSSDTVARAAQCLGLYEAGFSLEDVARKVFGDSETAWNSRSRSWEVIQKPMSEQALQSAVGAVKSLLSKVYDVEVK